ncbi:MAG: MBL fold metallo-hydrolase, partial [bacterium]|nr:MBL fold metallo-hydrolase [bacterium]
MTAGPASESESPRLEFHGAAREVTGSCHRVVFGELSLLLDCGLFQGEKLERNRQPFPFSPGKIDAVVLSHAHIDHSGRLPLLVKQGFQGPIYTHPATRDLCSIMLRDSAYIHEREAAWVNRERRRKGKEPIEPLYTKEDAEKAMGQFEVLDYGEDREILPRVRVCLRDAGHILGAAIVELWLAARKRPRKLVFSGDLGHRSKPLLCDPELVEEADLVVLESTYGDREHRSWEATWRELGEILEAADHEKGNILVPAFAVGRTQQLLYAFQRHFDEWRLDRWSIFLDSPLAIEATDVYARHSEVYDPAARRAHRESGSLFELPNFELCPEAEDSMKLNELKSGAIIIAGSGMCTGGRIRHHLKQHAVSRGCHLVIAGFQARGTLGRALVDGTKRVRLYGEEVRIAAQVHTIGGLSAHADLTGLSAWYGNLRGSPPVALVHGEPEPMDKLARHLKREHRPRKILCPRA